LILLQAAFLLVLHRRSTVHAQSYPQIL